MKNILKRLVSYNRTLGLVLSLLIISAVGIYVIMIILNNTRIRQIIETRTRLTNEISELHESININNMIILRIENKYGSS